MTPDEHPLLGFDSLAGGYGDTAVLRNVSGSVRPAQTLGVLGRNGVGKTTLMRLLMGYNRPFAGTVKWRDRDLARSPPFARHRLGISYAPQESVVFDELTVLENLTLHRASRALDDYAPYFDAFPRLPERRRQLAGSLSGGEKKLVSFVRALAENSPLTLLDEPTEGVQQENITLMAALVRARQAQGAAFIIVEQNLGFLQDVMDQVIVLDHGRCVLQGAAAAYPREVLAGHLRV